VPVPVPVPVPGLESGTGTGTGTDPRHLKRPVSEPCRDRRRGRAGIAASGSMLYW